MKQKAIDYHDAPLFEDITAKDVDVMLGCLCGRVRGYKKGEIIIMERDNVRHIGIVLRGTVHLIKEDIWGRQTFFSYSTPGELFGALFAMQRHTESYGTFEAATDVTALFVPADRIIRNCKNRCSFHQQLMQNMFDLLGRRSVNLMEKIEVSSKPTLREKLLAYFSMQAQKQHSRYIKLPLSRTGLADYLGVNRSAMTRELSAMRAEGLIDLDRNTCVLK